MDVMVFVVWLWDELICVVEEIDVVYLENNQVVIDVNGLLVFKCVIVKEFVELVKILEIIVLVCMLECNVLDILCNVVYWVGFFWYFGLFFGFDFKIDCVIEWYIFIFFIYGCNLGLVQVVCYFCGVVILYMLFFVNCCYVNLVKFDLVIKDIVNVYNMLYLFKVWGDGKSVVVDGIKYDMYDQNFMVEYYICYGGYGGIVYYYVFDMYVVLFLYFILCGVWEVIYIIDGLLKNKLDIQLDIIYVDIQG